MSAIDSLASDELISTVLCVDLGKSKIAVAVAEGDTLSCRFEVESCPKAFVELASQLRNLVNRYRPIAIGLSTFGPLEINSSSPSYGAITPSSMLQWNGFNPARALNAITALPVYFAYDVVAAANAELLIAPPRGRAFLLSWGSGIGGIEYSKYLDPIVQPRQVGHLIVPRLPDDQKFQSTCRFHDSCLQGVAGGLALEKRVFEAGNDRASHERAFHTVITYTAHAVLFLLLSSTVEKIVLVGGVGLAANVAEALNDSVVHLARGFQYGVDLTSSVCRGLAGPSGPLLGAARIAQAGLGYTFPHASSSLRPS